MITNSKLIPNGGVLQASKVDLLKDNWFDLIIGRFFSSDYAQIYSLFWIAVLAWLLAKDTILEYVYRCFSGLASLCIKDKEVTEYAHSRDFFKDIHVKPLTDLYDKACDELEDFVGKEELDFDSSEYDQYRYEEEVRFAKGSTTEKFRERKEQIERVIDDHLIFLHG